MMERGRQLLHKMLCNDAKAVKRGLTLNLSCDDEEKVRQADFKIALLLSQCVGLIAQCEQGFVDPDRVERLRVEKVTT